MVQHSRKLLLSGRTEADRTRDVHCAYCWRADRFKVRRGTRVKKDDIIAVLSDEAREAQVAQARSW